MSLRPRLGLRVKLTAALVAVAALAVVSAGLATLRQSNEALKTQKQQDELAIARNLAAQIDEVMAKARQTVEALAAHPDVVSMDPARQLHALTLVTGVTELIDGFLISDAKGRVAVMDQTQPDTRRLLPASVYEQFVAPAARSRATAFSEVYRTRTNEVAVAINAPILREGRLLGVLTAGILLEKHSMGGIEDIRMGNSGYAYIIDGKGSIIVHPQKERILKSAAGRAPVEEFIQRREGVLEFINNEGVPILAAFSPVKEASWQVVMRQPTAESYAHAEKLRYFLLLAFVGSLLCAATVGVALAWQISRPLGALARGVREVASGRLDTRIPVTSHDEVGDLARTFNDMTERLLKNREAIEAAHRLVLESEKHLARSERMAAVGQLAAGLAHEINNPLSVVSGLADFVMEKTSPEDPRRQALDAIGREAVRCQRLVSQLLDFAKPKEPVRESVDLNELVADTAALLRAQAKAQGVVLELRLADALPLVTIDRDQIKQTLLNLSLNACQAMPQGGVLAIETLRKAERVVVSVSDTGMGIAPEDMGRIFTPFFTTKDHGTGLGLATSYALVEQHGGTLQVQSRLGAGTSFTFSLPIGENIHA